MGCSGQGARLNRGAGNPAEDPTWLDSAAEDWREGGLEEPANALWLAAYRAKAELLSSIKAGGAQGFGLALADVLLLACR